MNFWKYISKIKHKGKSFNINLNIFLYNKNKCNYLIIIEEEFKVSIEILKEQKKLLIDKIINNYEENKHLLIKTI